MKVKNNVVSNGFNQKQLAILIGVVVVVGLIAGFIGAGINNSIMTGNAFLDKGQINSSIYPDNVLLKNNFWIGWKTASGIPLSMINLDKNNILRIGHQSSDGPKAVSIWTTGHPNALIVDNSGNVTVNKTIYAYDVIIKNENSSLNKGLMLFGQGRFGQGWYGNASEAKINKFIVNLTNIHGSCPANIADFTINGIHIDDMKLGECRRLTYQNIKFCYDGGSCGGIPSVGSYSYTIEDFS
jgi:hypothetical protein